MELGDMYHLGNVLRNERYHRGWTLEQVANKVGTNKNTISQLELGGTVKPAFADVVNVGNLYGFSPNEMAMFANLWQPDREQPDRRLLELNRIVNEIDKDKMERLLNIIVELARATLQSNYSTSEK